MKALRNQTTNCIHTPRHDPFILLTTFDRDTLPRDGVPHGNLVVREPGRPSVGANAALSGLPPRLPMARVHLLKRRSTRPSTTQTTTAAANQQLRAPHEPPTYMQHHCAEPAISLEQCLPVHDIALSLGLGLIRPRLLVWIEGRNSEPSVSTPRKRTIGTTPATLR